MVSAEAEFSGREDQGFNGRKIQRRAAGLSERGRGLSPTVTVGDGKKAMGFKGNWLPNTSKEKETDVRLGERETCVYLHFVNWCRGI
jgi:hypothetical protein